MTKELKAYEIDTKVKVVILKVQKLIMESARILILNVGRYVIEA